MEINPDFSDKAKSDISLVILARAGDQKAFTMLMKRHMDAVYFLSLKLVRNRDDAMDLASSAFTKAFKNLDKYTGQFAFSTWLFRIATNNAIDFLRQKRIRTVSFDDKEGLGKHVEPRDTGPDPEQHSIIRQEQLELKNLIGRLPEQYQEIITMRYLQELTYDEIAEKLDMPLGTVKARLFRAKDVILNSLKRNNPL